MGFFRKNANYSDCSSLKAALGELSSGDLKAFEGKLAEFSGVEKELAELVLRTMRSAQETRIKESTGLSFVIDKVLSGNEAWEEDCPHGLRTSMQKLVGHLNMLTTKTAALDLVDSKIMIADNNRVLNYVNQSANKMLVESQVEPE